MASELHTLSRAWGELSRKIHERHSVLVVDDEPGALKLFQAALASPEFACRFATTGEEALALFERSSTDLLLVDKNLPGIDGLELIRRIQRLDKTCEAVLVTAYASLESALVAMDLQTADFLTKPLHHINLIPATLKKVARRRNRRLLARRMVDDFKQAINARATDDDWSHVVNARRRWERFRDHLAAHRAVLLAEFDSASLRPAAQFLAQHGYSVPWVRSGKEALARCRGGDASVILIGDELEDQSPLELFDRLLELPARPEVILTSGGTNMHDVIYAISRGASGFVVEPIVDMDVLARKVERAYLEHRERLLQFKLVTELRRLIDTLGEREGTERVRRDIESALAGFDMAAAQVAVRLYESQAGESAWKRG